MNTLILLYCLSCLLFFGINFSAFIILKSTSEPIRTRDVKRASDNTCLRVKNELKFSPVWPIRLIYLCAMAVKGLKK